MANAYILSQVPFTYGAALAYLPDMLAAAGWTYQSSGDGLAGYNAAGKVFTNTGTGALGWSNPKAWARMQDPEARREFIFQHDNVGGARIKYSPAAKFGGGAPSATVTPLATDEKYLRGGATDAAPTYGAAWFNVANTTVGATRFHGYASGSTPFGFWYAGAITPAGALTTGLMLDPVVSVPEDPDPVVIHIGGFRVPDGYGTANDSGNLPQTKTSGGTNIGVWGHYDVALTKFLVIHPSYYAIGGEYPGGYCQGPWGFGRHGLDVNPFNGKYEALPVLYMRPTGLGTAPFGMKGRSMYARWTTIGRYNFNDTMDGRNWINVGSLWLPWDGVTAPKF